jgi:ribosomal protein L3
VSPDALLPTGTKLGASHFIPGQHVDIKALTKGKGFQGGMKKHGFKGQPRTHGVSLAHRSVGSIGMQGYARVLPGKRMPGRMGGIKAMQRNSWVARCVASDTMLRAPFWSVTCPAVGDMRRKRELVSTVSYHAVLFDVNACRCHTPNVQAQSGYVSQ